MPAHLLPLWLAILAAPQFVDHAADLGLKLDTNAACWVDFNNDDFPDLVVAGGLWINDGGQRFTRLADVGSCVAADFDNDGWTDLCCFSRQKLYRNLEGKALAEVALPELPATVCRGACWGDLDGDSFVDLFLSGYENWKDQVTFPRLSLRNLGGEAFELVDQKVQFRGRGVTACDFDRDGDLDIYVSNYRLQPNQLFCNEQNTYTNRAPKLNAVATSKGFGGGHSIGACWGDFDNDGWIDLFAGNFAHVDNRGDQPKSRFLRNQGGDSGFEDLGECGVAYQESYATPACGDYDNDGDLDLAFTTVYGTASFGRKNYPVLMRNDGGLTFVNVADEAGAGGLPPTYQAAWADFDRDGDLDLICGGKLLVNQGTEGHWLEVKLTGGGGINASAIGAQVRLQAGDATLTRQVEAGTGEGNQNDLVLHFGLGANAGPVTLEILWPGGKTQTVAGVAVDRLVSIEAE